MSQLVKDCNQKIMEEQIDFVEFIKSTERMKVCDSPNCANLPSSKNGSKESLKESPKSVVDKCRALDNRKFSEENIRMGKTINPTKIFKSSKTCAVFHTLDYAQDETATEDSSNSRVISSGMHKPDYIRLPSLQMTNKGPSSGEDKKCTCEKQGKNMSKKNSVDSKVVRIITTKRVNEDSVIEFVSEEPIMDNV
uniref:Breast cancer type 1 susceptibility protein homolog n=1 Tax=Rhabditophanes sp. KR3021 TaxID=114890 RepID=A0AC35UGA9_9BILA